MARSIWAQSGPVVVVQSVGVTLRDVEIEVTAPAADNVLNSGVALWIAPNVGTHLENVRARGRNYRRRVCRGRMETAAVFESGRVRAARGQQLFTSKSKRHIRANSKPIFWAFPSSPRVWKADAKMSRFWCKMSHRIFCCQASSNFRLAALRAQFRSSGAARGNRAKPCAIGNCGVWAIDKALQVLAAQNSRHAN